MPSSEALSTCSRYGQEVDLCIQLCIWRRLNHDIGNRLLHFVLTRFWFLSHLNNSDTCLIHLRSFQASLICTCVWLNSCYTHKHTWIHPWILFIGKPVKQVGSRFQYILSSHNTLFSVCYLTYTSTVSSFDLQWLYFRYKSSILAREMWKWYMIVHLSLTRGS
jgi:hypothetical protein